MPFIAHPPEALLGRNDSRNPATTCKGITSNGRACRRTIAAAAAAATASSTSRRAKQEGVLAVVAVEDGDGLVDAAAFYCWQHKEQAERLAASAVQQQQQQQVPGRSGTQTRVQQQTKLFPLRERSSIDTIVQRLGVLEVEDEDEDEDEKDDSPVKRRGDKRRTSSSSGRRNSDLSRQQQQPRRISRPPTWDRVEGPLMSVPEDVFTPGKQHLKERPAPPPSRGQSPRSQAKPGFFASLCCMSAVDEDRVEVVRHKKRADYHHSSAERMSYQPQTEQLPPSRPSYQRPDEDRRENSYSNGQRRRRSDGVSGPDASTPTRKPLSEKPARPINKTVPSDQSQTSELLSLIPKSLSPQTTSQLLAELSKPISPHDDEGYIYIFWLTDSPGLAPPSDSTAASLLTPPTRPSVSSRRTSDVLRSYSVRKPSAAPQPTQPPTILLKIGRASNVQRRMNEWSRQCGYELSLIRFYPYVSTSSAAPSPAALSPPSAAAPGGRRSSSAQHPRRPSISSPDAHDNQQPPQGGGGGGRRRASSASYFTDAKASNGNSPNLPLNSSSSPTSTSATVRKVPHAHRVERLVHLELGDKRVTRSCEACGKEHREWFEVEASREGVRGVDEVVRRWVAWAEGR